MENYSLDEEWSEWVLVEQAAELPDRAKVSVSVTYDMVVVEDGALQFDESFGQASRYIFICMPELFHLLVYVHQSIPLENE